MADAERANPVAEPSGEAEERALAVAAAQDCSEAAAELLRFAREGEALSGLVFTVEVTAHLSNALRLTAQIEHPRAGEEAAAALHQLLTALDAFDQAFGAAPVEAA